MDAEVSMMNRLIENLKGNVKNDNSYLILQIVLSPLRKKNRYIS